MATQTALVTGASTGIGRAVALRLDAAGWGVYAGVRNTGAAEALQAVGSVRLQPVMLDVRRPDQIAEVTARLKVELGSRGLGALVNNAGVPVGGPLEYIDLGELRRCFEVNTIAPIALVQAAADLLRTARGRIVFVSSIAARIAGPNMGPYSASKHAVSALAESLRAELHAAKVKVSVVEPGAFDTEIWPKSAAYGANLRANLPREAIERYEKLLSHSEKVLATSQKHASSPDVVAQAVEKAITARFPKSRYVVGRDARGAALAVRFLPDRLRTRMVRRI